MLRWWWDEMLLCLAEVQEIEASEGAGLMSDRLERILAALRG